MNRKCVLLMISVFLILAILGSAGCVLGAEKITLQWMAALSAGPELDIWNELVKEYESKHPNVKIQLTVEPFNDYYTKLPVVFAGGSIPDLVWMHYSRWKDYAELRAIMPLDSFISSDPELKKDDFPKVLVDTFTHKGKFYAVPKDHGGTAVIWYNVDKFKEAGVKTPWPDWTWNDFLEMAKKLTRDLNGDGKIDQWGTASFIDTQLSAFWHERGSIMIRNFGGDTYSDDYKRVLIDHPKTIEAIQFAVDLNNKYKVAARGEQLAGLGDPFRIGKVAMKPFDHEGMGFFIRYEKRPIKEYGVEFLPKGDGGQYQTAGSTGFAIPSKARHPKEAWEFIRWAVSEEVQRRFAEQYRWGEARADMMGLRFKLQHAAGIPLELNWQRVWIDAMSYPTCHPMKVPAGALEINGILNTCFDAAMAGKKSVSQAAREAKPQIEKVLQKFYK